MGGRTGAGNLRFFLMHSLQEGTDDAGSCACIAHVAATGEITVANLGDSRAVWATVGRNRGTIRVRMASRGLGGQRGEGQREEVSLRVSCTVATMWEAFS